MAAEAAIRRIMNGTAPDGSGDDLPSDGGDSDGDNSGDEPDADLSDKESMHSDYQGLNISDIIGEIDTLEDRPLSKTTRKRQSNTSQGTKVTLPPKRRRANKEATKTEYEQSIRITRLNAKGEELEHIIITQPPNFTGGINLTLPAIINQK